MRAPIISVGFQQADSLFQERKQQRALIERRCLVAVARVVDAVACVWRVGRIMRLIPRGKPITDMRTLGDGHDGELSQASLSMSRRRPVSVEALQALHAHQMSAVEFQAA